MRPSTSRTRGLSGSILIAKALDQREIPQDVVKAAVLLNLASYHLAYFGALATALTVLVLRGEARPLILVTSVSFLLVTIAIPFFVLALSGRRRDRLAPRLGRFRVLRRTIDFVTGASPRLVRSPRLVAETTLLQSVIVLLDAATFWTLIEAEKTDLFAEVNPNQKERIILALKKMGNVVGFLGDGVNDAPAMHAADTSLSVDQAVDVAREAADFVLLKRGLDVIRGRHRGGPENVCQHP